VGKSVGTAKPRRHWKPLYRADAHDLSTGRFLCLHEGRRGGAHSYLAKELGDHRRIAVNTVAPGAIATDFSSGVVRDNPDASTRISEMTALGRMGVPEDIGSMIASLLSWENHWVNGQRIEVSGGMGL
jgi:Enoyl-(Acyl carrier protein) reductase